MAQEMAHFCKNVGCAQIPAPGVSNRCRKFEFENQVEDKVL